MDGKLNKINLPNLKNLESTLSQFLQPVKPDVEFVTALKTKLTQVPTIVVESTRRGSKFIVLGLGVLVGLVVIWLIGKPKRNDPENDV